MLCKSQTTTYKKAIPVRGWQGGGFGGLHIGRGKDGVRLMVIVY